MNAEINSTYLKSVIAKNFFDIYNYMTALICCIIVLPLNMYFNDTFESFYINDLSLLIFFVLVFNLSMCAKDISKDTGKKFKITLIFLTLFIFLYTILILLNKLMLS